MEPKAEYGWMITQDRWRRGDQHWNEGVGWEHCSFFNSENCSRPRRRKIVAPEGWRIVPLDEIPTPDCNGFLCCFVAGKWSDSWFNVVTRCFEHIPANKLVSENPEILAIATPAKVDYAVNDASKMPAPPVAISRLVEKDAINPSHYKSHPSGVECIQVTEHMTFNIGNVVKYCWRNGLKGETPAIQDLKKAAWYLNREIEKLTKETK